ncbi:hypothetical protein PG985_002731 [Apiospora marii]|uniref:uncharacterized protein n=1 Tax=Apiospora marii TaxID=335849 RepID=UPI00313070EA
MESWKEIADEKQKSLLAKIPEQWLVPEALCAAPTTPDDPYLNVATDAFMTEAGLSPRELALTSKTSIPEILASYESLEVSVEELVTAFCHRAAINHQTTESLAEIWFAEAIAEAKAQDEYLRTNKKLIGPLHGIPVSLKDQYRVDGLESAIGFIGWLGKVDTAESESLVTRQIKELGGIVIAKTHVPQTLLLCELQSNMHRSGMNPHNRLLSPGGSSGGEGSLLAARGSVMGMGTDMGGSIRVPSAYTHLFGLKPSSGRISYRDLNSSLDGKPVVPSVAGPMSATLENVVHITRALVETEGWRRDPGLVPLPWRAPVLDQVRADAATPGKGLCFATFPGGDDGIMRLHPPIARGVDMAVRAARQAGHRVIDWKPPSHLEAAFLYGGLCFPTLYDIEDALKLSGEPMVAPAQALFRQAEEYKPKDFREYYELVKKLKKYQQDYADYWESTKALTGTGRPVDGILVPVTATAAVRHNSFYAFTYSIVYNVLDYSSLAVPVTFADKSIDVADPHDAPRSPIDEASWIPYDADVYHGAPVGVQIVGRRLEEEKILALGEVLSNALNSLSDK